MMNSPFSKIFLAIMARVQAQVPEIKHIDQDMGQIEGSSSRPAVAFPLILADFDAWGFSNAGTNIQIAEGDVVIKLGFAQFTPSSDKVDAAYREEALKFYEIEWKLHKALQGWSPGDEFGFLTRTAVQTQNRQPGIRVRVLRYRLEFEDYSTQKTTQSIPKPPFEGEGDFV